VVERIVGIDPGSHRIGYAVIENQGQATQLLTHGCFDYPSTYTVSARLIQLEADIQKLCMDYQPSLMAIESLFFNKNSTTAMRVSESRGIVLLAAAKQSIPTVDCTPLQVKMAITGYGRADKQQIKQMIQLQFQGVVLHKLDDAVDAIGIALTGQSLNTYLRLNSKQKEALL
jgi:crossover junction endodeoxyribonuclease RuvC